MARYYTRDINVLAICEGQLRGSAIQCKILRTKIQRGGDLTVPQKFILEIDLGNAGMRSPVNIRDALRAIADKIRYDDELDDLTQNIRDALRAISDKIRYDDELDDLTQKIRDINGNVVGHYEVI